VIMKQGVARGIYYSVFIIELYFMSKTLTGAFPQKQLISVLFTIDAKVFKRSGKKKKSAAEKNGGLVMILYYMLRIFSTTYSELNTFFKNSSSLTMKEKVIYFFKKVFVRSLEEYEKSGNLAMGTIKPTAGDFFYTSLQIVFLFSAFFMKGVIF